MRSGASVARRAYRAHRPRSAVRPHSGTASSTRAELPGRRVCQHHRVAGSQNRSQASVSRSQFAHKVSRAARLLMAKTWCVAQTMEWTRSLIANPLQS